MAYLGLLTINGPTNDKINCKHHITFDEVREAIQWPAPTEVTWEDHPYYGWRLLAYGIVAAGRGVFCVLKPVPPWDDYADTWEVQTARWVD